MLLAPLPRPAYTLVPGLRPLEPGQQAALEACLVALTGRLAGVVVTAAGTNRTHHVIELATSAGTLLVLERATPAPAAAADPSAGR